MQSLTLHHPQPTKFGDVSTINRFDRSIRTTLFSFNHKKKKNYQAVKNWEDKLFQSLISPLDPRPSLAFFLRSVGDKDEFDSG